MQWRKEQSLPQILLGQLELHKQKILISNNTQSYAQMDELKIDQRSKNKRAKTIILRKPT